MFHDDMYGHVSNRRKPLATASLVFGILSIVLCSVIYLALPLGALAIIFAVLSHTEYKMAGKSRAGMICGFCGIIATIVVTVFSFYYVLTNPTMRSYVEYYVQMYSGDADFSLDAMLEDLLIGDFGASDDAGHDSAASENEADNDQGTPEHDASKDSVNGEDTPSDDFSGNSSDEEAVPPVEMPQEGGKFL